MRALLVVVFCLPGLSFAIPEDCAAQTAACLMELLKSPAAMGAQCIASSALVHEPLSLRLLELLLQV